MATTGKPAHDLEVWAITTSNMLREHVMQDVHLLLTCATSSAAAAHLCNIIGGALGPELDPVALGPDVHGDAAHLLAMREVLADACEDLGVCSMGVVRSGQARNGGTHIVSFLVHAATDPMEPPCVELGLAAGALAGHGGGPAASVGTLRVLPLGLDVLLKEVECRRGLQRARRLDVVVQAASERAHAHSSSQRQAVTRV